MEDINEVKGISIKSEDGNIDFDSCDTPDLICITIKNVDGDKASIVVNKRMLIGGVNLLK